MSLFSPSRRQYQIIDGEDNEAGPLVNDLGASPPTSHAVEDVSYQGTSTRRRNSSISRSYSTQKWDHIENLDEFFRDLYKYHQGRGYICMVLHSCFPLFQFLFIVSFTTFLGNCVDYNVLFNNKQTDAQGFNITGKKRLADAIIADCASHFSFKMVITLLLSVVFFFVMLVRVAVQLVRYKHIQEFYNEILEIPDFRLGSVTWNAVMQEICKVQPKLRLSVNQATLNELDIYARILRHKNFMIAMVYEDILPSFLTVPFLGTVPYLPTGMKFAFDILLFRGPWSPWKNHYQLKDEFKDVTTIETQVNSMRKSVLIAGIISLVFLPFIFIYQTLYTIFTYVDLAKREPGSFGKRMYSNYGREKLRHFNELDHEMRLRLNRSYEFAVRYMDQFISPLSEQLAKYVIFVAGSIGGVLFLLTVWDEDVLTFEHVITALTAFGVIAIICRTFIRDENQVFCPDFLMKQIVGHIHYAPESWLMEAQSQEVVEEFGRIFHMQAYAIILDILSPLITPFVLLFSVRPKVAEIVQFFHEQTTYVDGLGDVCSYALMDVKRHGDRELAELQSPGDQGPPQTHPVFSRRKLNCRGKIELSLLNFANQNPGWRPSEDAAKLIAQVRERLSDTEFGPLLHSLRDLERPVLTSMTQSTFPIARGQPRADIVDMAESTDMRPVNTFNQESLIASVLHPQMERNFMQPAHVQESNRQALQMSMNALLLNQIMQNSRVSRQSRNLALPSEHTYGSLEPLQPMDSMQSSNPIGDLTQALRGLGESRHEDEEEDQVPPMHFQAAPGENVQESDIWGVPTESQHAGGTGFSRYGGI